MATNWAICTIIAKNYLAFARTLCESFRRHCREFKPFMVEAAFQKSYKAMTAGDYRTGVVHLKEAYAYDRSSLFDPLARAYTKWAAKLWFNDQTRRLSTRWKSNTPNGGA
jgi:hypothetical protein